jgi:hypothetical protein
LFWGDDFHHLAQLLGRTEEALNLALDLSFYAYDVVDEIVDFF